MISRTEGFLKVISLENFQSRFDDKYKADTPMPTFLTVLLTVGTLISCSCSSVEMKRMTYSPYQVEAKIYQLKKPKPVTSVIIVMPPTGGPTYLEHSYSKSLANKGFKVISVQNWEGLDKAAISLGQIKQIDVAVIIAAGAPVSEVIATSNESSLASYRKKRFKKYGFKETEEYEKALKQTKILNPIDFKDVYTNKKVMFVKAKKDKTVNSENQEKLIKL